MIGFRYRLVEELAAVKWVLVVGGVEGATPEVLSVPSRHWDDPPFTLTSARQGLHTGLQSHAVQASPAWSPRKRHVLIRTAVDVMRPPIDGLVMSRPIGVPAPAGYSSRAKLISQR
jgi:hypothetical protein